MSGKYPSTIYRVSLKAIIRNSKGEVLLSKEDGAWFFPGGGIEHGETDISALKRELYEEALIDTPFTAKLSGVQTVFVKEHGTWIMWIFYDVVLPEGFYFATGDVQNIAFWNPKAFEKSDDFWEQTVYKMMEEKSPR